MQWRQLYFTSNSHEICLLVTGIKLLLSRLHNRIDGTRTYHFVCIPKLSPSIIHRYVNIFSLECDYIHIYLSHRNQHLQNNSRRSEELATSLESIKYVHEMLLYYDIYQKWLLIDSHLRIAVCFIFICSSRTDFKLTSAFRVILIRFGTGYLVHINCSMW